MENVLVCTVGGSPQPIVTAIRELAPLHVCFLCTDRDPATGQPGSRIQIEGKGNVIGAHPADKGATLPSIPAQTGLDVSKYEVHIVPADDLDGVVDVATRVFDALRQRFPDAQLIADFTGGTKTMTAGLVIAALEHDNVELRLVTGARADLNKVYDGTQSGTVVPAERVKLRRQMAPYLSAWRHFNYSVAAEGLEQLASPRDAELRGQLQIARDLSRAFDAWDRFDHDEALRRLNLYRPRIGERAGLLLKFLNVLCLDDSDRRKEPARLLDLWLNAQRRAAQGRYDDAVARAYRLLEWTAQWLLRSRAGIDTSNIAPDRVPADIPLKANREGIYKAGLYDAWRLVAFHLNGPVADFARAQVEAICHYLQIRNRSILAHGYTPIREDEWKRFSTWMSDVFCPLLHDAAKEAGLRTQPPQLPDEPFWM